jgi:hypothetical protein
MNGTCEQSGVREASLRATRRFWEYLNEIPGFWRPCTSEDYLRIWSIDAAGTVTRVPAIALEGFGKRIAKDTYVASASVWCCEQKPDAVVIGMECWACQLSPEGRQKLLRNEGGTPDMTVLANRERLINVYGAKLAQRLIVQANCSAGRSRLSVHTRFSTMAFGRDQGRRSRTSKAVSPAC